MRQVGAWRCSYYYDRSTFPPARQDRRPKRCERDESQEGRSPLAFVAHSLGDQLMPADRLMQEPLAFKNNGLFDSSDGIGRFTSVPKLVPAFDVLSGS